MRQRASLIVSQNRAENSGQDEESMQSSLSLLHRWMLRHFAALKFAISGDAALQPTSFRLGKHDVADFATNGRLAARLEEIDDTKNIQRIFVMGCGRSGTWLLTGLMATFNDTCVVAKEVPVELFARLTTTGKTLVLKRNSQSYQRMLEIPDSIKIAYAIRHPFDVLTSHNPMSGHTYHIDVERWLGEMVALRSVLDAGRKNFCVLRYEDMVRDPVSAQAKLGQELGLEPRIPAQGLASVFRPSGRAKSAMHGLRNIDARSLYKYKNDPTRIAYLKTIKSELGDTLDWVASRFGYDTSLQ
jgi:hypothetical protein